MFLTHLRTESSVTCGPGTAEWETVSRAPWNLRSHEQMVKVEQQIPLIPGNTYWFTNGNDVSFLSICICISEKRGKAQENGLIWIPNLEVNYWSWLGACLYGLLDAFPPACTPTPTYTFHTTNGSDVNSLFAFMLVRNKKYGETQSFVET